MAENTVTTVSVDGQSYKLGEGTSNYSDLSSKPQINNVELSGNKTLNELGIQEAGDYATKTELGNVTPTIGENGNWFVNGEDTSKPSRGEKGETGPEGPQGPKGDQGEPGPQGNSGVSGDTSTIEVINDLSGGESSAAAIKVLAAEQGKVLDGKITNTNTKLTELEQLLQSSPREVVAIDLEQSQPDKMITASNGTIISNANYSVTPLFNIPKGHILIVQANTYTSMASIAISIGENKYKVIRTGTSDYKKNTFICLITEDSDVACTYLTSQGVDVSKVYVGSFDNILDYSDSKVEELKSLLLQEINKSNSNINSNTEKIGALEELFEQKYSKNIYDGSTVDGFVDYQGNFSSISTGEYKATDLIPIKPNTYYYLSQRDAGETYNIRCLDNNKESPMKVLVAANGSSISSWGLPTIDGSSIGGTNVTQNGMFLSPSNAAFVQINLLYKNDNPNYNKIMLEEVGDIFIADFVPSPYEEFETRTVLKEEHLPFNVESLSNTIKETISLKNTPTILICGSSYCVGFGSVKDKAFSSYLSNFLDWNVENYSRSGYTYIDMYNSVLSYTRYGGLHPSDLNGGKVLLIFGGNDTPYFNTGVDGKYFARNIELLARVFSDLGFEPILCSYFGTAISAFSLIVKDVADKFGFPFININAEGARFYEPTYTPWWYNGHYGTRTNAQQWYNLIKCLSVIGKPSSSIKIYRPRITFSNMEEMLYEDSYEKMRKWREISIYHSPLSDVNNKYVDRLDLAQGLVTYIDSEYNLLRKNNPISFNNYALVEAILPATTSDIVSVSLTIETEDAIEVFVKRNTFDTIDLSGRTAVFNIKYGESPTIVVGDVYTDSQNPGIDFTILEEGPNNSLIAKPSQEFNTEGNYNGVLTRKSGTGSEIINYVWLGKSPSSAYLENVFNEQGEFVALENNNNVFSVKLPNCIDYDKMVFIIKSSTDSIFEISDIVINCEFKKRKDSYYTNQWNRSLPEHIRQEQLLSYTNFNNANTEWGLQEDSGILWDGVVEYTSGISKTHIPKYFSDNGVQKILKLYKGKTVSQTLQSSLGENYKVRKYALKVVGRYYPEEANNIESLPSNVRTSETFDMGRIEVSVVIGSLAMVYSKQIYLPLSFVEAQEILIFDCKESSQKIQIKAIDDDIELLSVELYEIEIVE